MSKQNKPPRWIDDRDIYKIVWSKLERAEEEEEDRADELPWEALVLSPGDYEREVVLAAWQRGDPRPLADLVLSGQPILLEETRLLVRDLVLGNIKRKHGRPRLTIAERRARNPKHAAAELVPVIEDILRQLYPDQPLADVKDRAGAFAEELMGIDDPASAGDRVHKYLRHGRKDRSRLP